MGCCGCDQRPSPEELGVPRKCTDLPCLIVFIIFWCGMIFVAAFAFVQGDAWRLVFGADSFGNTCGTRNSAIDGLNQTGLDMRGKPYLFPMDITQPFDTAWICVKQCPSGLIYNRMQLQKFALDTDNPLCFYDVDIRDYTNESYFPSSELGPCPVLPIAYNSTILLNRCIPQFAIKLGQDVALRIFGYLNNVDIYRQVLADLILAYREIIMMAFLALILALIFVFLIRFIYSIVIYIIFAVVAIVGLAASGLLWYVYVAIHWNLDQNVLVNGTRLLLICDAKNEHTLMIYAIASTCITGFLLFLMCCMWRQVSATIELFAEAGKCLAAMPCLLIQPLWTFIMLLILFIGWCIVLLMLSTSSYISRNEQTTIVNNMSQMGETKAMFELVTVEFNLPHPIRYMTWYHIVGLVWTSEFVLACQQLVVASAVATWYFSRNKGEVHCPIFTGIKNLILFHLGSVALGSFIITLVKLPRMILMYLQNKFKDSNNPCVKCCMRCCICCLWCIERCLRYLHHNAYTIVAIEGRSFCPSAKMAFDILASNAMQVALINSAGDLVLFLAKCGVTVTTGVIALLIFKGNERLHFWAVPLLLVCFFAFFIAHCFFSVYEMVIDTLFLCFCEDKDLRDNVNANHEMYSPKSFKGFVDRNSKKVDKRNVADRSGTETLPLSERL